MKMVFDFLKQELDVQCITDELELDLYQKNLGIFEKLQKRNIMSPETFGSQLNHSALVYHRLLRNY